MAEIAIDAARVQQLIEQAVKENILSTLEAMVQDANWLAKIETMINQTATEKTLDKLTTIDIPAIVSKQIDTTFDKSEIQQTIIVGVQKEIKTAITNISQDPTWLGKIEQVINQSVAYQTLAQLGSIDINTIIKDRVDENMDKFHSKMREDFSSVGINDQATKTQLTIMDQDTVFENTLVTNDLEVANGAIINNLVVKGSINTDNLAWNDLSSSIQEKTLKQFNSTLRNQLIKDVADQITTSGIEIEQIKFGGESLVSDGHLASNITQTNIQRLGTLNSLQVSGPVNLNETVRVNTKRMGINTEEPEMALSVWDEEVAINVGKHKEKTGYIGTSRPQALAFGTNRNAHIEITVDGLTQIKKLQVGVHRISHDIQVPGYAGTKGDIVFNSNLTNDRVFAWVCLGGYKWQPLKAAE